MFRFAKPLARSKNSPGTPPIPKSGQSLILFVAALLLGIGASSIAAQTPETKGASEQFRPASRLSDLSGLVCMGGSRFVAAHDAKSDDEPNLPRLSLLELPIDLQGVTFTNRPLAFQGTVSNDLESASRIPGTNLVVFAESGDGLGDRSLQRLFLIEVGETSTRLVREVPWPVPIYNVEATAIAKISEDSYLFIYAERNSKHPSTKIRWAAFDPKDMTFGSFREATYHNPMPKKFNRPVVAMDVDGQGRIFIASAFDAEDAGLPDPDNGPFSSGVFYVGNVNSDPSNPKVELVEPVSIATLDGLKVESVAFDLQDPKQPRLFVGVDDENYGATLRQIMLPRQMMFSELQKK